MMKAICVLLLLLCACQAFGEGPANDNGFEQDLENGFDGMNNDQEADTNTDEGFNGDAQERDELDSDEIEDKEEEDNTNVSQESFENVMSRSYDMTSSAPASIQGVKPDNRTVCYLRTCKWIVKKIRQYYPVSTKHNYTQHYPVTVKVPQTTKHICGQIPYNVTKPYQVKVPVNKKTCHVYHGHKYCSHKTIYEWVTKFRTFTLYKPKYCTRTTYKINIIYKTRTLLGSKTIFKFRLIAIKRYICSFTIGSYYNPGGIWK